MGFESAISLIEESLIVNRVLGLSTDRVWSPKYIPCNVRLDDCYGEYGEDIVDRAGYIAPKQQIDNFRRAGKNLEEYRRLMYTNEEQSDDPPINQTVQKGFDEFDAHELMKDTTARIEKSKKEHEALERSKKENEALKRVDQEKEDSSDKEDLLGQAKDAE